jgi:hypothetical protein
MHKKTNIIADFNIMRIHARSNFRQVYAGHGIKKVELNFCLKILFIIIIMYLSFFLFSLVRTSSGLIDII